MTTCYSQSVPHTRTKDSTAIRRTHRAELVGKLSHHGSLTLFETFSKSAQDFADRRCLGYRPIDTLNSSPGRYLFRTYAEVSRSVRNVASGLMREGLILPNSDGFLVLGLYLKNSCAWVMAENACYYLNAVVVPLYDTLGTDTLEYIINQTGIQTIICSAKELSSLATVASSCPTLGAVVVADLSVPHTACLEVMKNADIKLFSLHDIERIGEAYPCPPRPPQAQDIATICYTSGTTGKPKGAVITHQNMVSVISAGLGGVICAKKEDLYLSFLPLPHIFERIVVNSLLAVGAGIGFYRGDILKVVEDLAALEPTIFCAVPRLYTRIHDKFLAKVTGEEGMTGYMLRSALSTKLQNLRQKGMTKHNVWDRFVFSKAKNAMGMKNVRLMISGGAPLPTQTMEFFRVLLGEGCTCHEGYGMTETTGATCVTSSDDLSLGHVGGPFPCCEVKLVDVPEMGYLQSDRIHGDNIPCDGRGEVWVRGSGVISGYFKDEEETEAAGLKNANGWLKSGDIGMWLPKGQLSIIDRKKNMFKLSQGEYIAVEKIEGILTQVPLVSQLFLYGESTESRLVAVVVPDMDAVAVWKKKNLSSSSSSFSSSSSVLTDMEDLAPIILEQMKEEGKKQGLKGYELVYAVTLEATPWTPENGFLTPTMKLKRVELKKKYLLAIQSMYENFKSETSDQKTQLSRL